jgi:hypothetical protein
LYSFHFHEANGSFISSFFPSRRGPDYHVQTYDDEHRRPKRWLGFGTSCGITGFIYGCSETTTTQSPARARGMDPNSNITTSPSYFNLLAPAQDILNRFQLFNNIVPTPAPATVSPPPTEPQPTIPSIPTTLGGGEATTTEFPMYGDVQAIGSGLDDFGFTTHPPWSAFNKFRYEETTEMSNPFALEGADSSTVRSRISGSGPKKLCFGLQRNCGARPTEKPRAAKSCPFGFKCKESKSYLDRFAVKTTTTTTTTHAPNAGKKKTKEECEAEEKRSSKGRSSSKSTCKGGKKCSDPCAKYKSRNNNKSKPSEDTDDSSEEEKMGIVEGGQEVLGSELVKDVQSASASSGVDQNINKGSSSDSRRRRRGAVRIPANKKRFRKSLRKKRVAITKDKRSEDDQSVSTTDPDTDDGRDVAKEEITKKYLHEDYMKKLESPFVGIRDSCEYVGINEELDPPRNEKDIVQFYLKLMRVACLPLFQEKLQAIFDDKLISMVKGSPFTIRLEKSHPIL